MVLAFRSIEIILQNALQRLVLFQIIFLSDKAFLRYSLLTDAS